MGVINALFDKEKAGKDNKRFALASVIIIPLFFFFVFTFNDWVFGTDARFIINNMFVSYHSAWVVNGFAVAVWFATLLSFAFIADKKQNALFIGSLFLLNLFNIRLLMPDFDNWVFLLSGMFIIIYFKNNPIKIGRLKIDHMIMGLLSIVVYFVYRNFTLVSLSIATDMIPNVFVFLFFIPTYYMLFRNKNYSYLAFILVGTLFFMSGKFTANALPLFIYSLYVGFVSSDLNLEKDKWIRLIIFYSLCAFLLVPFLELNYPMVSIT